MYFPHFTSSNNAFDETNNKIDELFSELDTKPIYIGYIETNNNLYLFYKVEINYRLELLTSHDKWWWGTIFEIVNSRTILKYQVHRSVYSIFYKYPLLCNLFSDDGYKLPIPYVSYIGGSKEYIAFISVFGLPKALPTFNLGPYFYSYTYYGAGRNAIWTYSRKSEEKNGKVITQNEYGVHIKGGIVRLLLFGVKVKYFLNRDTDLKDDSLISKDAAENVPFIKETLKLRDVNGKWAQGHDLAYIGNHLIKQSHFPVHKRHKQHLKDRKLNIQWAARNYYQQIPLTYHYVDTTEFSKITNVTLAINMPYEYKDYDIE